MWYSIDLKEAVHRHLHIIKHLQEIQWPISYTWGKGYHLEGAWQAWEEDQCELNQVMEVPSINTNWGMKGLRARLKEKYFGIPVDKMLDMNWLVGQLLPGLHQKQADGGDFAPLLYSGETPTCAVDPALESSKQEKHAGWSRSGGGSQKWSEEWSTFVARTDWEN